MVQGRATTKGALESIDGVGDARVEKSTGRGSWNYCGANGWGTARMRRAGQLFEPIVDRDNLRLAAHKALRGKRSRLDARAFVADWASGWPELGTRGGFRAGPNRPPFRSRRDERRAKSFPRPPGAGSRWRTLRAASSPAPTRRVARGRGTTQSVERKAFPRGAWERVAELPSCMNLHSFPRSAWECLPIDAPRRPLLAAEAGPAGQECGTTSGANRSPCGLGRSIILIGRRGASGGRHSHAERGNEFIMGTRE